MTRRAAGNEPSEDGLTCAQCGDLATWDATVCPGCGWRLGAEQLTLVGKSVDGGEK